MQKQDIDLLNKLIGIPWKEDGRDYSGADCGGLMQLYFNAKGIKGEAPKISEVKNWPPEKIVQKLRDQSEIINNAIDIKPEDILVFNINNELHVGLYLGYGRMLHARAGQTSKISPLNIYWIKYFTFAIRIKDGQIFIPPAGPPVVIGALIAAGIGTGVGYITGGWQGALLGFAGGLLFGIGAAFVGAALGTALQSQYKKGGSASSMKYQFGELQTSATNQIVVPRIYGPMRFAGNIVAQNPIEGGEVVDMIVVLCEGEIESISNVLLDGEPIANFPGCSYIAFLGTPTQNVETDSGMDLNGVQYRNLACLYIHLESSDKLKGGRPNIICTVEGQKVQTWNGSSWSSSKTYSTNPVGCIRDYLITRVQRGGCGYSIIDLHSNSFGETYDDCNDLVDNGAGGTEKRYEISYAIDQKRAAIDNLSEMLLSFAGTLFRSGSQFKLICAKSKSAVASIEEADMKDFRIILKKLDQKFNRLGIEYIDPDQDDAKILAWGAEDKADQDRRGIFEQVINIPSIEKRTQALRLANQFFYELKLCPLGMEFFTSLNAISWELGDVVNLTHSRMNWTNKSVLILGIEETEMETFRITVQEYNSTIYNDRYGATIETFKYGTPPNPYAPVTEISNLQISEGEYYLHKDGTVGSDILISWNAPSDSSRMFLSHYQIELKKAGGDWHVVGTTTAINHTISGIQDEITYQVRVKTVSINHIVSDGIISSELTILGKLNPPANPTGFEVYQQGNQLRIKCDPCPDVDFAFFRFKKGSEWSTGDIIAERADVTEFSYPVGEIGLQTFMVKAVDRSGIESNAPGIDTIDVVPPPDMNFVNIFDRWGVPLEFKLNNLEQVQANYHNSSYVRPCLALKTATTWEEREAEAKTWEQQEADGGLLLDGNVETSGYAEMIQPYDIGTIIEFQMVVDADYKNVTGGTVTIQVSYSEDGITYPSFAAIDPTITYRARYLKFKIIIETSDAAYNVYLYNLYIYINAPSVKKSWFKDVLIPIAGKTLIFDAGFTVPPRITHSVVNGVIGLVIFNNKTKDQVNVMVYDPATKAAIGTAEIDAEAMSY
jgi:hypothetical protein